MRNCLLRIILPVVCIRLLAGCARHYDLKLANGSVVATASKPRLENGSYHFKDASGRDVYIPATRVREIAPASMSKENEPKFKPTPQR